MSMYYYEARVHHVSDVPISSPQVVVVKPFEQSVMSPYLAGRFTHEEYAHILAQLKGICDDAVARGTLHGATFCCRLAAVLTCGVSMICTGIEHPSDRMCREFRHRVDQLCASLNAGLVRRGVRITPHYASMSQGEMWFEDCLETTPWGLDYWAFELGPAPAPAPAPAYARAYPPAPNAQQPMHVMQQPPAQQQRAHARVVQPAYAAQQSPYPVQPPGGRW